MPKFIEVIVTLILLSQTASALPIRVNVDSVPITLDPPLLTDSVASWVLQHIADRLVEEHKPGQLQGNLASSWKISSDKKRYCFEIKKDQKFSDGSELSAQSIKRAFDHAVSVKAKSRVSFYLENIRSIETPSKSSVCINLKKPSVNFLQILADASFSIAKPVGANGDLIYSGQYTVGQRAQKVIELVRRSDGQIFRIESMPFAEALSRFKSGDLEIIRNNGTGGYESVRGLKAPRVTMPDERTYFFSFNLESAIFKDPKNRRMLAEAIDWNSLQKSVQAAHLAPSRSLLSPTLFHSGTTQFTIPTHHELAPSALPEIVVLMQEGFELGAWLKAALPHVRMKIRNLPKAEFLKAMKAGQYDLMFTGYGITVRDWDYLATLFQSTSAHNMIFLKDKSVDDLLVRARESEVPGERLRLYQQVLSLNYLGLWYLPVTHTPLIFAFSPVIKTRLGDADATTLSPWFRFDGVEWNK